MLPETEAIPEFPMPLLVRSKLSRMTGTRGAGANVETRHVKKEIHDRWEVLMCGVHQEEGSELHRFALGVYREVELCGVGSVRSDRR